VDASGRRPKERIIVARLAWVEEADAEGRIAELYALERRPGGRVADIVKAFSGHPEALAGMLALSEVHFAPGGALGRARRELIATHVSALLGCRY
jgi:alkylhydroperoxidase family enzyme